MGYFDVTFYSEVGGALGLTVSMAEAYLGRYGSFSKAPPIRLHRHDDRIRTAVDDRLRH